jgi:hypothetical protein
VTSARERVSAWLDQFGRAREKRDAEQVGALFSEDASCREGPFDEPLSGTAALHAHWSELPRRAGTLRSRTRSWPRLESTAPSVASSPMRHRRCGSTAGCVRK